MRDCGLPLTRRDPTWSCARGHAFDIARAGYVNLLQPQDRQSPAAGDSAASVAARARLLSAGIGQTILDGIVQRVAALGLAPGAFAADLGSGSGELLEALTRTQGVGGIGIDLSTAAAERASRRFTSLTWVVANADRRLPLVDAGVQLITSVHGRRNPVECARAMAPDGWLVVAVAAADDLVELREVVQGTRVERNRADSAIAEHAPHFTLRDRATVRERHVLDGDRLRDLLQGTYRGSRSSAAPRVAALTTLAITLAADVLVFVPAR